MNRKQKIKGNNLIVKNCAFCGDVFNGKRKTAVFCSDLCRIKFHMRKTTTPQWYADDPNEGKKLPPGTITSWEMPEDKLVFMGDLTSLFGELTHYLSLEQLLEEREFILKNRPFSETSEWCESAEQIFTDENFMEVFSIFPDKYKLYVWPWDNGIPFS